MNRRQRRSWVLVLWGSFFLVGAALGFFLLQGCADLPPAETAKAEASAVACWAHIHNAMKANPDCESKRAVADIIAQADTNCVATKVDLSGLQCGDGGTRDH